MAEKTKEEAQKIQEDAKERLICFADNGRDIFGFGVYMGPGLPQKSKLLFYRMYNDPEKQNLILFEEDNPFVVVWGIDLDTFRKHVTHLFSLAAGEPSHSIPASLYYKMWKAVFSEDIFEMVDAMNHLIEFLRNYLSREEILFVPEKG